MSTPLLKALAEFSEAAKALSAEWESLPPDQQDSLDEGYPFEQSFDEIVHDVSQWADSHCDRLAVDMDGEAEGLTPDPTETY